MLFRLSGGRPPSQCSVPLSIPPPSAFMFVTRNGYQVFRAPGQICSHTVTNMRQCCAQLAVLLGIRRRSLSALTPMSHTHPTATSSSSTSNFQIIFNNALKAYQTRTKNDLLLHPLAAQLQTCDSPGTILTVLQEQVRGLDQSRNGDERWTKWLDPTVNVLFALSATIGASVSLVCPRTSAFLRSAFSYLFGRFSHRRM